MIPAKNNIIIRSNLDQKEIITFGCLKLYIPFKSQYNGNQRESNPVLAEVVVSNPKFPQLKEGDLIVCMHTTLVNQAVQIFKEDTTVTLSIPADRYILGKLGDKGELIPLFGNMVATRISETPVSSIIITPDSYKKTDPHRMNIVAVAQDVKNIKEGSTVVCYIHSDYEAVYSVNGEERRVIVVYQMDVLAVA